MKGFRMCRSAVAQVLLWWVAGMPAASHAGTLHLVPATSRIEYHIDHSVAGVTNIAGPVSGAAETDSAGFLRSAAVEVDLRGLQTGIGMRDRHVKSEDCLDVERFPTARFTWQPVSAVPDSAPTAPSSAAAAPDSVPGDERPASAAPDSAPGEARPPSAAPVTAPAMADSLFAGGTMDLHGQTHGLRVPLHVTREGAGLRVQGRFTFALADWGIKRPKRFMLAAGKTVDVRLDLHFEP